MKRDFENISENSEFRSKSTLKTTEKNQFVILFSSIPCLHRKKENISCNISQSFFHANKIAIIINNYRNMPENINFTLKNSFQIRSCY